MICITEEAQTLTHNHLFQDPTRSQISGRLDRVCVWSPCSVDMKNRQCSSMSIVDRWRPNALVCIHGVYKCVEKVKALHTHFVDIYIYKSVYEFV